MAIDTLNDGGYDVLAYQYPNEVLIGGNPGLLPDCAEDIRKNYLQSTVDYRQRRFCGVSLGMGMGLHAQRQNGELLAPGIYAAGGTDPASVVMHNPLFLKARSDYKANNPGLTKEKLSQIWQPLQQSPQAPFVVALGILDPIVLYWQAQRRLRLWAEDAPNEIVPLIREHSGTIKWFNHNIANLLRRAQKLEA